MHELHVGNFTYGHEKLNIVSADDGIKHKIKIGKYCSIANDINIFCGKFNHSYKFASTHPFKELYNANCPSNPWGKSDPIIGNDVWIGAYSVILPGVEIGNGAIIASHSVVSKSVPAYAIVAGNPSSVKKFRFSTHIISMLQASEWWNIPHDYLISNIVPHIEDIDLFLIKVKEYKDGQRVN
jgi:virginiamycin A acetyltransferase